jgi:hypothetical protein
VTRNEDTFAKRLREAGAAVTPATSEALHARVMGDVRRERAVASSASEAPTLVRWWWMLGGAAATAATVGVALWRTTAPPAPGPTSPVRPVQVAELPAVPSFESVVVETVGPVRDKLHEARYAYLDRDAKRLARFLIRAVPGVPHDAGPSDERL